MTKASDNIFPKVTFVEGSAPSSPSATDFHLYFDSGDHLLKWKNSAGTVTTIATGSSLSDPMTSRGDIIIRNASNVTARLAIGSSGKVLSSDGTDITWQTPSSGGITQAFAGYNTIGGTTETPGVNSKLYFKKVTLANACLLTSIDAYVGTSGAGAVLGPVAALYDDNAGAPGKVIGWSSEFGVTGDMGGNFRWLSMPIGAWLAAADYWLAIRTSDSGGAVLQQIKYDSSGSDQTGTGVVNTWKDASLYTLSNSTLKYSIRANTIR